jgi:hypothetical protein
MSQFLKYFSKNHIAKSNVAKISECITRYYTLFSQN